MPCSPVFYPSPGHKDVRVHDHTPNARYFVVAVGRCGSGVFTKPSRANWETDGFSGCVQRSCKTWLGYDGVEDIWQLLCDRYHVGGCPPRTLPAWVTAPTPVVHRVLASSSPATAHGPAALSSPATSPAPLLPPAVIVGSPLTPCQGGSPASNARSPVYVRSSVSPSPLASRRTPLAGVLSPPPYASSSFPSLRTPSPSLVTLHAPVLRLRTPTLSSIDAEISSLSSSSSTWTNLSDLFAPDGASLPSPSVRAAPSASSIRAMRASPASPAAVSLARASPAAVSLARASPTTVTSARASPSVTSVPVAPSGDGDGDGVDDEEDLWDDTDVDENSFERVYWAVVGLPRHLYSTAAAAVAAAERRGWGARFTLLSSTDEAYLEAIQDSRAEA
ncbi:hypothetical protein C8R45DRAFT_1097480 [Mycena sanguinolenta]|nr:hypothetical protein C8R45DRAFT_1097480 [Mycena sanguinolenta]